MTIRATARVSLLLLSFLSAAGIARAAEEEKTPAAVEAATGVSSPTAPAPPPKNSAQPPEQKDALSWVIEGYLAEELRFRHADSDSDTDSYTTLYANARRGGPHPISARLNGRLVADLAGDQAPGDALRDLWDSFSGDVQLRLYEAYVQVDKILDDRATLRGGRQFLDEGTWFHFDGARLDFDLDSSVKGLDFTVFGGVPVRFGESNRSGNWILGLVARYRLDERTRFRLEYVHVSEHFEGINPVVTDPIQQPVSIPEQDFDDDLVGLSAWHRVSDHLRFFGRFTLLNADPNELELRANWSSTDALWTVVADFYRLFGRLQNVTNDLTPFVPMLGAYQPFWRIGARATRRIGEEWIAQAGISFRQLDSQVDESAFNHEYVHYYASATRFGLFVETLDLTVTVNGYSSSFNDVVAIGGHLDYELKKGLDLDGGIDYSLYKYDFFLDTEHEDVWTYSVRLKWKASEKVRVRLEISVDDDKFTTWTTIALRGEVRF